MSCSATCSTVPNRPKSPTRLSQQTTRERVVPGGKVIEEITKETIYETFTKGDLEDKDTVLKEDLKRVHKARRKLITDIYAHMPVII